MTPTSNPSPDSATKDLREGIKEIVAERLGLAAVHPVVINTGDIADRILALLASRPNSCKFCGAELKAEEYSCFHIFYIGYRWKCNCPDSAFREREIKETR